jgi:hypothetical protein
MAALEGDAAALLILGDWIEENYYMPPYEIGTSWIFFLATRYVVGRVSAMTPFEIILDGACWVPDTGRMYDALASGDLAEVEPFPAGRCVINRFAINDATPWTHALPSKQK